MLLSRIQVHVQLPQVKIGLKGNTSRKRGDETASDKLQRHTKQRACSVAKTALEQHEVCTPTGA
jgi:hypothetical protein